MKYEQFKKNGLKSLNSTWMRKCKNGIMLDFSTDRIISIDESPENDTIKPDELVKNQVKSNESDYITPLATGLILGTTL